METRITPSNSPPIGVADQYTVVHDQALYAGVDPAGVLDNDSDPDEDPLTAELYNLPTNGWLDFYDDGSFDYYPDAGFVGVDTFEYQAHDGMDYSDPIKVTITVSNQAPVANADSYDVHQGDSLYVLADGVLTNDTDADEEDSLTAELYSWPSNGWVDFYEDGGFDYYPDAGFVGTDSFQYQAYDGAEYSDPVTVTIDVTNQAPVAGPETYYGTVDGNGTDISSNAFCQNAFLLSCSGGGPLLGCP